MMAASIGEAAVSGISLVDQVMALLISLFAALATGGCVVAGQYLGAKKPDDARQTVNQLVWVAGIAGICVMALLYLLRGVILRGLFGSITQEVYGHAHIYLLIVAASVPFVALYNAGAALFRTTGNSRLPMQIMLAMNLFNIGGNIVLVRGLGLGTAGIAIPTLVSRFGAAVIVLGCALRKKAALRLERIWRYRPDRRLIRQILHIGIPYSLENGMFYFGKLLVLSLVSTLGTAAVAANSVGGTICSFEALPGMSIGLGLSVVIARCVGAGDHEQARFYTRRIFMTIYGIQVLTSAIVLTALPAVLRVYDLSPEASHWTTQIAWSHAIVMMLIWPLGNALSTVFRAYGDAKFPMVVSTVTMFLCRVALAYLLVSVFDMNVLAAWIAIYCDWLAKGGVFVWRYLRNIC